MAMYVQFILYVKDNTNYFLPIKFVRKFSKRDTLNINEPDAFTFHKYLLQTFQSMLVFFKICHVSILLQNSKLIIY